MSEDAATDRLVTTVTATDRDAEPQLVLSINWETSLFFKNRAQITTQPEWQKSFVIATSPGGSSTVVEGTVRVGDAALPPGDCTECVTTPLDREQFDSVRLCLTVTDEATKTGNNTDESK